MTGKDPAILRAERLRVITSMPEYSATIGKWIAEAHDAALHDMTNAKEPYEFHAAQGAYKAVKSLMDQFDGVNIAEDIALKKKQKLNKE